MSGNRIVQAATDQQLLDGSKKHLKQPVTIDGQQYQPADVAQNLQGRIDAAKSTDAAKAQWKAAREAEKTKRAATRRFVRALRATILAMFGNAVDVLADFGLTPPKPRDVSPKKKVEAAAKAKETRAARHTMGKKQRANIKAAPPAPPRA